MKKAFVTSMVLVLLMSVLSVGIGVIPSAVAAPCPAGIPASPFPADNDSDIVINIHLDWSACSNTSYYLVYFDTNPSPAYRGNTTTATNSYTLSPLSYNTTYYWRIEAFNGSTCNTSGPVWNFTTTNATTLCATPNKPQTPSPTNGSTNPSTTILLSWNASANASYYEVYFGTSEPLAYYGSTANSVYPLPQLNTSTKCYWKVIAKNACDINSSDIWNFTTGCPVPTKPQISSPMSGSDQIAIYDTYLSWNASTGASLYDIYFGTSATPTYQGNTSNTSYQLPQLNQSTKYYWQVVARNACGNNFSDIWNFTTGCPVAVRPKTLSPANGSTDTSTDILLNWNASANASYYEVFFGTSESPDYLDSTDNNSYQLSTLNISTKYYWKVVAKSVCDMNSSDIWNFTTGCPVPKPQNPSPMNGSDQISIYPYLSWNASANASLFNAVFFDIYFGTSNPPMYYGNTSNSSYQLPQLNYSTTYYWKIVAFNNSACNASSPVWNFTIANASSPTLTTCGIPTKPQTPSPTNGSTNTPTITLLGWDASANASYYEIYFGTSEPPAYYGNADNSSYQLPQLNISTKYYWSVIARSACGINSSDTWNFTTGRASAPATINKGGTPVWLLILLGLDGVLTLVMLAAIFIVANRRSKGKREASGKGLPGLFRIPRLRRAPTPPKSK